jgi:hypothetical protein
MKFEKLKTDGLTGESLSFVAEFNKRFAEVDFANEAEMKIYLRGTLGGLLDDDGKVAIDTEKIKEFLGEGKTGFRSILKAQGEAIEAIKLRGNGGAEKRSLRGELEKRMSDIESAYKGGGEFKLNLRAAAIMTTANTVGGYEALPEDLIESFSVGAFVEKKRPREYVFDIANVTTVAQLTEYKTWLEEGDEEGAFAIVAEGTLKPLVSTTLVRNHSQYKKVAGKYVVTEEFAKFRSEIYNIIKRLISQKMLRDYSTILTTQLLGDAAAYVASALDGQYTAAEVTDYHAIAAVAAQIEGINFMPDVLIMNPQDKWRIGMSQDANGAFYMTIPYTSPTGETQMMGFSLRTSTKVPVGSFILGESGLWEIEQESITVRIGHGITITKSGANVTDVEDDFDHNRIRMIVENYFHSYIATNNTGSFVYASFDVVKALLVA